MTGTGALVVGCGAIGSEYDRHNEHRATAPRSHAGAYRASGRLELAAGVDPDEAARERFTELWGVPAYASIEEAISASTPLVASICTPTEARRASVAALLGGGARAIWIEKPLAPDVETGEEIVALCAEADVPLQVNFLRRFDPLHRRVAERVRGRVLRADLRYSGTLDNYGSHAFDLFRWFVGEPVRVGARRLGEHEPLIELETADGRLGTLARIEGSALRMFDCDLWLADERLAITALGEQLLAAEPVPSTVFADLTRPEFRAPDPELGLESAMSVALGDLLSQLDDGAPPVCSGLDGVAELRLRAAVALSIAESCVVELGRPVDRVGG